MGVGGFIAGAAALPFRAAAYGAKAYGHTLTHLNWRKPVQATIGASMIAAPVAAAGAIAYTKDTERPARRPDYGDFLTQQTVSNGMSPGQMSTYDINRSLGSTQSRQLMKLNGIECLNEMEKQAFLGALAGFGRAAAGKLGGALKNQIFGGVMTGGMLAMEGSGLRKEMQQSVIKNTSERLPQFGQSSYHAL